MNLITEVEIFYYRSIYKQSIQDLKRLNVLFGRNDSGKSNVLRALNLFFTGETNPRQPFSFDRDLCQARRAEASTYVDARKFVSVKLTFATPRQWRNSLGKSFYVKRTWSATTGSSYNQTSSVTDSKQQYLTRFLNKVRFHYIPAIKDRSIFEKLLGEVYEVLSIDEKFAKSLDSFTAEVKSRTNELTGELQGLLDIESTISPPTDLKELFRSLDFDTKERANETSCSLTLQRGDGVQVRHIPAILRFISNRSKEDFHVWGFEEPENSLELANAIKEANFFVSISNSANIQVFLTSHSPAFFNLEGYSVSRRYVTRQVSGTLTLPTSSIATLTDGENASEMMGETPHLAIISHYLKIADKEICKLKEDRQLLEAQIDSSKQSLLFVEGESDRRVVEHAWSVLQGGKPPFKIVECSGTTKMKSLAQDGRPLSVLAPDRKIFCLVDNDGDGRELYKNGRLGNGGQWVQHPSNKTFWCRLKPTPEFVAVMSNLGLGMDAYPFTLESCFGANIRFEAKTASKYELSKTPYVDLMSHYSKIADIVQGDDFAKKCYVMSPDPTFKDPFAEWICERSDVDSFAAFREIFDGLAALQ